MPRNYRRSKSLQIMESIDRQNQREAELRDRHAKPATPASETTPVESKTS